MADSKVDLNTADFQKLVNTKGLTFLHEKVIKCSCISTVHNNQPDPNCTSCKGTGWYHLSAKKIKAICTNLQKDYEFTSEGILTTGLLHLTCLTKDYPSYMDRFSMPDTAKIVYSERVILSDLGDASDKNPSLRYPVLDTEFVATREKTYVKDTDYSIVDEKLVWAITPPEIYSVRYITTPRWLVANIPHVIRGTFVQTKVTNPTYKTLPVNVIAKLEFRFNEEKG